MNLKNITGQDNSTQDFVPIKEIKNGTVILKDGSMRSILMVSSINFGLKSADEKTAIILAFQNFLNSIDFSIQIFIESKRLDIKPYLHTLEERMNEQTNELLKIQIKEYIEFIKFFTDNHNVMTKSFFVVIPYSPAIVQISGSNFISGLLGKKKSPQNKKNGEINQFEENLEQLNLRINVVKGNLNRIGLRSEILGTEELIELYFKIFNPGETATPNISEVEGASK
jgi:hypothetical protein